MKWILVVVAAIALLTVLSARSFCRVESPVERVKKACDNTRAEWGKLWGKPVFIRIIKEEMLLELWVRSTDGTWSIRKNYPIHTFGGEDGPKQEEGDGRAPEGFYRVRLPQLKPNSDYHMAFNIGYPNAYDLSLGRTGSFIMVHGDSVSIGCFAVGDAAIEEIYTMVEQALRAGQQYVPVQIYPFRMTPQRVEKEKERSYHDFLQHLLEGWDFTEREKKPFPDKDA